MNRHSVALLMTICVVSFLSSGLSHAADFGAFEYRDNGTTITITRYNGSGGDIIIPDTIDGKPVTEIGSMAFEDRVKNPSTLALPSTLTTIGELAFYGCSGFTETLKLPKGVTTIGGWAFFGCSGVTDLKLPSTLSTIGWAAFYGCSGFKGALKLPSTLTDIGHAAFKDCSGISKAVFWGNAPTDMGEDVFEDTAEGFMILCSPESTGFTFPFWKGYPCEQQTVEGSGI